MNILIRAAWRMLGLGLLALASLGAQAAQVVTNHGAVEGVDQGGVRAFLGIPYAQPPVGPLRWRAPQDLPAWPGVRATQAFAPACMQDTPRAWGPFTDEYVQLRAPISEDCLYLNVWTPQNAAAGSLPVLVWIHGGGFGSGAASVPIYDGASLAARGAVVVSINYRLGLLGFLSHPALAAESPQSVSGNYGLLDMVAALRWVQANIARFGGRADQVTIAGQSAGAAAVVDLLAMPSARGLFQRAIAMSGAGMGARPLTLAEAQRQGEQLLNQAGIGSLAELRQRPAESLLSLKPAMDFSGGMPRLLLAPVVDGQVLPVDPETTAAALASPVPLVSGYMADEGFVMGPPPSTPASFEAHVRQRYGAAADGFLAAYPHADDAQATASMRQIGRDRYMASLLLWAERRARLGQTVYGYVYERPIPGPDAARFGAFHTGEVPYLFGVFEHRPYTAEDRAVSVLLQTHWLGFAAGRGLPAPWTAITDRASPVTRLGQPVPVSGEALSSPQRLRLFADFVAAGGVLTMF
ncbi:carboxylesterase family protein [Ideonella sp. 4Y11]|uniref:Carboxylic ester hydrolase n=1 Tax=Ideonella aquatica TaxID=2824119 RepID=A0A940YN13_9BURK|nr:carboxylesterase family protein [Ideonella aquatica]MBQ0960906.1 carboxylesterase family protein [Ideonella aquatica]